MITIGISKLQIDCIIGCFAEERLQRRSITIDLTLKTIFQNEDKLGATVDYSKVAELIEQLAHSREFHLLESLAMLICSEIFKQFLAVQEIWLHIAKPKALLLCDEAFVEIERKRE